MWPIKNLTLYKKLQVYQDCVIRILLGQQWNLHLPHLPPGMPTPHPGILWQNQVLDAEDLSSLNQHVCHSELLNVLGHVYRTDPSWPPKVAQHRRFEDVGKCAWIRQSLTTTAGKILQNSSWRQSVVAGIRQVDGGGFASPLQEKGQQRKIQAATSNPVPTTKLQKHCHPRVGLFIYQLLQQKLMSFQTQSIGCTDWCLLLLL